MNTDIYLQKVEKILSKTGFENFSMERLATLIGVTKKTLYNNFESKDDLFRSMTDAQRERIRTATLPLFSVYGINGSTILREWFLYNINFLDALQPAYLPSLLSYRPEWYDIFTDMMRRNCREFAALLIPRGRYEGLFNKSFDSDSYALFLYRILITSSKNTAKDDILFLSQAILNFQPSK